MKRYGLLLAVLVTATFLAAACSSTTKTSNAQKPAPEAAVNATPEPTPAISTPAENPPAPPPPTPPKKAQSTRKPVPAPKAEQATAEPAPAVKTAPEVEPQAKAPAVAEPTSVVPIPKVQRVTVPAGTLIPIRMIDSVDSKTDQVGQTFRASIDSDITIQDQIIVPKGADARLTLTLVSSAGEFRGKSQLQLELDRIAIGEASYVVKSDVVERQGKSEGTKTARDIGIGAAVGAAVGAITGGGKGAAIGAGVGAGGGAVVAGMTKGEQVVVPSETYLEFRLQQPIQIAVRQGGPTD